MYRWGAVLSKLVSLECCTCLTAVQSYWNAWGLAQKAGPVMQALACSLHRNGGSSQQETQAALPLHVHLLAGLRRRCSRRHPLSLRQQAACSSGGDGCLSKQAALSY